MEGMIIHLRSWNFYNKLNQLLGEDVMDRYGPRRILYETIRHFDITMEKDQKNEIILKKVEKIEKKDVNLR
jgi:hypothetical protein